MEIKTTIWKVRDAFKEELSKKLLQKMCISKRLETHEPRTLMTWKPEELFK